MSNKIRGKYPDEYLEAEMYSWQDLIQFTIEDYLDLLLDSLLDEGALPTIDRYERELLEDYIIGEFDEMIRRAR